MPGWWKKSPDSSRGNKSVNFSRGVWHFASKYTFCGATVAWHWMRKCREAGQGGWQMWGRGKNLEAGDDSSRNSSRRNMAKIYSVAKRLIIKTLLRLLVNIQWSKQKCASLFFRAQEWICISILIGILKTEWQSISCMSDWPSGEPYRYKHTPVHNCVWTHTHAILSSICIMSVKWPDNRLSTHTNVMLSYLYLYHACITVCDPCQYTHNVNVSVFASCMSDWTLYLI